ncbi:hypothetical protein ACVRXF_09920 [Streptococcus orisasini]
MKKIQILTVSEKYKENLNYSSLMVKNHSMGKYLKQYLELKVHHLFKNIAESNEIIVIPDFSRDAVISSVEKNDKLFNYMRPTVTMEDGKYIVHCYPGIDYVFHYFCILKSYFEIINKKVNINYRLPKSEECFKTLEESNLKELPKVKTVILGYVDPIGNLNYDWEGEGVFKWKKFDTRSGKSTLLLGCEHTYWGDISGYLVSELASMGVDTVIYVGKLGGLKSVFIPNESIATGNVSIIPNIGTIKWDNIFSSDDSPYIYEGVHVTLPSVLQETENWLEFINREGNYDFVDPEIGHMARAANKLNIQFSFLHIISDNLELRHEENLSNERREDIRVKRKKLLEEIQSILYQKL